MAAQTTAEIARDLVVLIKEGKETEAVQRYYAPDIVCYEAMNPGEPAKGLEAIQAKHQWWAENMVVHSREVQGPFLHGDQFAIRMTYQVTEKAENKETTIDEVGVYIVRDGKIAEERFYY